eukprot:scaffold8256_cov159-Alexandrium_tamarense.AAC.1
MYDVNVTTCHLGDDVWLLAVGRCADGLRVVMERRSYSADVSRDEEGRSETLHVTRDVLTTMRCCRQLTT